MACKRSEQCEHADICKYAKSNAYDIWDGSCYRPKEPQTNEQWFCQLPISEKAKVLSNATYSSVFNSDILVLGKEAEQKKWELWLKEKHHE